MEPLLVRYPEATVARMFGVPFGLTMGVTFGAFGALVFGVLMIWTGPCALIAAALGFFAVGGFAGTLSGLMVGPLMAAFVSHAVDGVALPALEPGETLRVRGPANHRFGWTSVPGWLYLTDRRLRFVPTGAEGEWSFRPGRGRSHGWGRWRSAGRSGGSRTGCSSQSRRKGT